MRWTAIIGGTRGIGFAATLVQEGWSVNATGVERGREIHLAVDDRPHQRHCMERGSKREEEAVPGERIHRHGSIADPRPCEVQLRRTEPDFGRPHQRRLRVRYLRKPGPRRSLMPSATA